MNQRNVARLKRRLNPERNDPALIHGYYLDGSGRLISAFAQSAVSLPQEENEKYMALFKRLLSGALGQNLLPIQFTPAQLLDSPQYRLLTALRDSALEDQNALEALCQRVVEDYILPSAGDKEQNYLVLLMYDAYDLPPKDQNDQAVPGGESETVYSYILCGICPVKRTRPGLSYFVNENQFHSRDADWMVAPPEAGFLFPAFEDHGPNLGAALYYTKDTAGAHQALLQGLLGADPVPAAQQRETFQSLLSDTLSEECSLDLIQSVNQTLSQMLQEQKADKDAPPLKLSKAEISAVLDRCGASPQRVQDFAGQYDDAFGQFAQLDAVNIAAPGPMRVETPGISIKVSPDCTELLQTRFIDGRRYILVPADGPVEVNGMSVAP